MTCDHGTYQCTMPVVASQPGGKTDLLVVMWCTTCGDIALRLPQVDPTDARMAAVRAGATAIPVRSTR